MRERRQSFIRRTSSIGRTYHQLRLRTNISASTPTGQTGAAKSSRNFDYGLLCNGWRIISHGKRHRTLGIRPGFGDHGEKEKTKTENPKSLVIIYDELVMCRQE